MPNNYVPYHVHTDYSLLDSNSHYDEYVKRAVECGMKAIAFSEHGRISGWVKKKVCCDENNIKYIHAVEIYLTEKLQPKVRDNYHTVLIAKNFKGVQELNEIVSKSFDADHFYFTNRISFNEFLSLSSNIIATSACLASPLNQLEVTHPMYQKLVDRYDYLEIQPHLDDDQIKFNQHLAMLAQSNNKKLIAGTDTHNVSQYKAECRKILLEYKKQSYGNEDNFDLTWKTYDELICAFEKQGALPASVYMEAIDNTNRMADSVDSWDLDVALKYPILYGSREKDHEKLVETVERKFAEKLDKGIIPLSQKEAFRKAIDEELRVFTKIQMDGFMLSESELISWCKENGIQTGNARGSVAGSRVAYVADIIDLNPETWHTVFSRFANEDRVEVGDIDTDVIESDRPKIFEYIKSRFGYDKTARVASFGTIADKGVIDVVCGALREREKKRTNCEDKDNPYSLARAATIKTEYEANPEEAKEKYKDVFYYFDGLLGCKVSQSVHPAGMVISPITLADNYGVFDKDGDLCLFLDMDEAHHVGLVKYDFLVLKNVGMIKSICENVGIKYPRSDEIDWNDQNVWKDMTKSPVGIFQMEGTFAFELMNRYQPKSLFDLSLVTAAIRPSGASYRDDLCAHKIHKNPSAEIDELLKDNNGFLVYQEDVIKFLQQCCGLTGSEADNVRRGIAKKKMDILDKAMPKIISGYCAKSTNPPEVAKQELQEFIQIIKDASEYMFG